MRYIPPPLIPPLTYVSRTANVNGLLDVSQAGHGNPINTGDLTYSVVTSAAVNAATAATMRFFTVAATNLTTVQEGVA